jgi:hypothetical protein
MVAPPPNSRKPRVAGFQDIVRRLGTGTLSHEKRFTPNTLGFGLPDS